MVVCRFPSSWRLRTTCLPKNVRNLSTGNISELVKTLRELDTASLCDADKSYYFSAKESGEYYHPIHLLDSNIRPINEAGGITMAGVARTVRCATRNDFLAVLQGLAEGKEDEVLVVDTQQSTHAVAGELFGTEMQRKGMAGMVVDGPVRDAVHLQNLASVRFFASSTCPYSGTIQGIGKLQIPIRCGGLKILPGDIIVGDNDGIITGSVDTFSAIIPLAKTIQDTEARVKKQMEDDAPLASLTNYERHLQLRGEGKSSALEFLIGD